MLRTITVTALLALGIVSAAAEEEASTQVSYADLDLSQPNDAKAMAARLQDAATAVCVKANPDLGAAMLERCVNLSVNMAMARIRNAMDEAVQYKISNVRTAMRD